MFSFLAAHAKLNTVTEQPSDSAILVSLRTFSILALPSGVCRLCTVSLKKFLL
jgi:hypothetical protein